MIYVISFGDEEYSGESLEELHDKAAQEQETCTPEYCVKTYSTRLDYILRKLPPEFQAYVSKVAWDRGHSAGASEVLLIAEEMAHDLVDVAYQYNQRLWLEWRKTQQNG